jgi:AcrR family transcriptional regulator
MPSTTTRRRVTPKLILEAAWQLARAQGLTGWTMRDLASAVGIRAPSLYAHFGSKHEIYDAMFADGYRTFLARAEAVELPSDPRAAARVAARTFVEFAVADPARLNLLFLRVIPGFEPTASSFALAEEVYARGVEILARAGLTEIDDVDLWTAVLSGLATQQVSNDSGGDRWVRLVDRAVDLLLDSAGVDAA